MNHKIILQALADMQERAPYGYKDEVLEVYLEVQKDYYESRVKKERWNMKLSWLIAAGIGIALLMLGLVIKGL